MTSCSVGDCIFGVLAVVSRVATPCSQAVGARYLIVLAKLGAAGVAGVFATAVGGVLLNAVVALPAAIGVVAVVANELRFPVAILGACYRAGVFAIVVGRVLLSAVVAIPTAILGVVAVVASRLRVPIAVGGGQIGAVLTKD